ncbi:MAG: ribonuclease E/G [Alphaproteobacteria bacterium]|jgi:ribonuclease E|nr:ribonuclease E/G [Alphaproteobacteria bacterium]MDP6813420.1 ribonuclease E/G [Alphaproteobacteria bacterium]
MIEEILVNTGPRRRRLALVARGRLLELLLDDRDTPRPGRLILGRVRALAPDLDAAFVDIGEGRQGFLPARDAPGRRGQPIGRAVQEGQALIMQVNREAEDEKGPRLSCRPRLTGRGLVLLPRGRAVVVSERIKDAGQRRRLEVLGEGLAGQHGRGLIVRTAAAEMSDDQLGDEAERLVGRWAAIKARADAAAAPALLDAGDDGLLRALRDHLGPALSRIVVDDAALAAEMRGQCRQDLPAAEGLIGLHDEPTPLFARHDIEGQIEIALGREVPLPSGGRLTIETTRALCAIDVDTAAADGGGDSARLWRETNMQAAAEVARQLRLREIGGNVVIDFIRMQGRGDVGRLLRALHGAFAGDRGSVRIGRMSELGLVELSRRRRGPGLAERLGEVCPCCAGSGHRPSARAVADNLLERIRREAAAGKGRALAVTAAVEVVADLGGPDGALLTELAARHGCRVRLTADPELPRESFQVSPL